LDEAFSRERAFKVLISPAHNRLPLLPVTIQALVLGKLDRSHGLIFRCPSRNLFLNCVARIHENLSETNQRLPGCFRIGHPICRALSGHEDVGTRGKSHPAS
jgi:hypothetical protein